MTDTATVQNPEAPLLIERDGAVVVLRFNRPKTLNAVDVPMAQAFLQAARELASDTSVRAIMLCGAGKAFMAGGDLATLSANPRQAALELIRPLHEALTVLAGIDAPLVAQVHGVAAGAGLSLMLQADFAIAAEGTRFNMAYVNIGASCDVGASWALPRLIGLRRALEVAMLGETLDSTQALQLGLLNRVVPAADLETQAMAFAQRLANGPTVALGRLRRLMRSSFDRDLPTQLEAEAGAFLQCAQTEDFRIGVDAFFAKQPAQFVGG